LKKTVVPLSVKGAAILFTGISAAAKYQLFLVTPTLRKTFVVRYAKILEFPIS
jgi:hypothetical protein